jgi:UDP-N-acetylmuramyl tripeptide synthase
MAAALTVLKLGIQPRHIKEALIDFIPAFGRQEEQIVDEKKVKILLSKNPAGFNASLRTALDMKPKVLLLALNDRIPDGRDVSWIWDVDFEMIPADCKIIVSGDRVYDMALRIEYSATGYKRLETRKMIVEPDLKKAINKGLETILRGETYYILATYSAMLDIRKIIIGRKIL